MTRREGTMFRFADPALLWLLLVVPLYVVIVLRLRHRFEPAVSFPLLRLAREQAGASGMWKRSGAIAVRCLILLLVIIGLARPQAGRGTETVLSEGIDILLVMDVSGSMRAEDFKPQNRLAVAKSVVADFIEGRVSDRMGMVVFASEAYTQCPLTLDYDVLLELLDSVELGMVDEQSTAIGLAIATGANRLRESEAKSKVMILLTDGRNNAGEIDPVTAAQAAAALGIRIYTIAAGTPEGGPIPVDDPVWGRRYVTVPTDIDEDVLREIAQITGGRYFRAKTEGMLADVYSTIDELEKTKVEVKHFTSYTELGPRFALAALVAVLLELLLVATVLRRIP
jgi:Ca-activated chloride channel family protein